MKKLVTLLFAIATFATLYAQVPKGFNYQAVVRNSAGNLMINRNVGVNISILQGSETGTVVYSQEPFLSFFVARKESIKGYLPACYNSS